MKTSDILQQAGIRTGETVPDVRLAELCGAYERLVAIRSDAISIGKILGILLEKELTKEMRYGLQALDELVNETQKNSLIAKDQVRRLRIQHLKDREIPVFIYDRDAKS